MSNSLTRRTISDFTQQNRGWLIALGILMMIAGAAAIIAPLLAALAVTALLGWLLLIGGIFQFMHSVRCRSFGPFLWEFLLALLYIFTGAILLFYPLQGVMTVTVVLAVFLVIGGLLEIFAALSWRPARHWGWLLMNGILALILGALIWSGLPGTAVWMLGLLVGINLLFRGASLLAAGLAAGKRGGAKA